MVVPRQLPALTRQASRSVFATMVTPEMEHFARIVMSALAKVAETIVMLSGRLVPTPLDLLLAVAILALAGMELLLALV